MCRGPVLVAYTLQTKNSTNKVFPCVSRMSRDVVKAGEATWDVVIGGYVENRRIKEAMDQMLRKMQNMGFKPNEITISSFLPSSPL